MSASEHNEEQFEAFLQGRDALSQRLKALEQPEPPEPLNRAIHDRVDQALRNERQIMRAANDGANPAGTARPWRMRMAWAVAAGLLLAVVVGTQWRREAPQNTLVVAQQEAAPAAAMPPQAIPAPAPASAPHAPSRQVLAQADIAPTYPPIVVRSGAPAAAPAPPENTNDEKARNWLNLIDGLLTNGLRKDALDEWGEFRKSYPDYPVPKGLKGRIDEIQAAAAAESK